MRAPVKKERGILASMQYAARDRLYGRRWRQARQAYLVEHPLCKMCEAEGKVTPARDVDHIVRHKGNPLVFWDETNWQGLCKYHHQSVKASEERSGKVKGCDITGLPLSPAHHWK